MLRDILIDTAVCGVAISLPFWGQHLDPGWQVILDLAILALLIQRIVRAVRSWWWGPSAHQEGR